MKRLDLHGDVVARFAPHNKNVLIVSRRGTTRRPAAMDTIGLDLHKRESQLCIGQDDGRTLELRIVTSRERFTAMLGASARPDSAGGEYGE